ncbi:TetR/AcrR family transcriptional regulator [Nocardia cyriacigeorgica]|uniref:TetR/AcrR family transcriptional regulator n=1 Tax=Nocardia cyriacigeorgica TaxID=135487 RepID=UPI001892F097|nr:TetR/AcrR family transcriptional regulator [Nocardia cyriacigeorgica]MBF6082835.1 TetR/AcrR family transcriptional regulator [Nocardia cyriacigeorgica]MBF6427223.1 TetR/AcrR family transcriptional regulator [Nocardia cyriacigeorgica]BDU05159.1 TetR family transcriptional regulator [Nocardia cyriacigeorgica]
MARLSGVYDKSRPGLPRGRSRLPPEPAREEQRARMLRGTISAVAEKGFAATTVSDITARARVSRREFYQQFGDKQQCFLDSVTVGAEVVLTVLANSDDGDGDPMTLLRRRLHDYLALCSAEPEFTRCLIVELPAVGPLGLAMRNAGYQRIAELLRRWHDGARQVHPEWPPVPEAMFTAAIGAIEEMVLGPISAGFPEELADAEPAMVEVLCRLLAIPQ